MKRTIYIIFTIIFIGCTNQEKHELDPRIEKFESFLGKEESNALNELVKTFELFLEFNFDNSIIDSSYNDYLTKTLDYDFANITWIFDEELQERTYELFEKSGLSYQIYLKPIEVWKDDNTIKIKYLYIDKNDTVEGLASRSVHKSWNSFQVDSIINQEKELITYNRNGRFFRGLELIKEQDSTIIKYLDDKNAMGDLAPSIVAGGLLAYNPNFSDYFLKRIIAVELYKRK